MNFSKFSQYLVLSIFLIAIYSRMWYIIDTANDYVLYLPWGE